MATFMGDALRSDTIGTTPCFAVEIGGMEVATFSECSGLSATVETGKWQEGGLNHTTYKFPGRADYGNLTLKHGMTDSPELYDWFLSVVQGGRKCRKNITVKLVVPNNETSQQEPLRVWQLLSAFPVKWSAPSLQAGSNGIAIESLEIAHNGLVGPAEWPPGGPGQKS